MAVLIHAFQPCANLKINLFALPAADLAHIMEHAGADLEALRGKRIFLTGGTGFFGKWLLGALVFANAELALGLRIRVLSRDPRAFIRDFPPVRGIPAISFKRGDVTAFTEDDGAFDYILHAATDARVCTSAADEQARSRTIVEGTRRMLRFAQTCGAQRLMNFSSGGVYGVLTSQPTGAKEDDFAQAIPLTEYGKAKHEAERLCAESGVDFVTTRGFAFLGPHLALDAHFAAGNFLRDALAGGPIVVRGGGTALRSYLHPADLVVWLARMLVRGQNGRAYNIGSDEVVSTAQLAQRIAGTIQPVPEVVVQSTQPPPPPNIYLPDITRARTELQLDVLIPLQEAILRTLSWLRRQS